MLNAQVSADLLLSIFNTRSPLHDGAVIIKEDRIVAARVILPLADRRDDRIGTRTERPLASVKKPMQWH